jgi:hypothetical protein
MREAAQWQEVTSIMSANQPDSSLPSIIDAAKRFGFELDEEEAREWLTAISASNPESDISVDPLSGVFGHRIAMLDFSPSDLAYFREVGRIVEFADLPGQVETALALSGSAAQSKIQTDPGDCDYFERVNIKAPTRAEACRLLASIMRDKALTSLHGRNYQLIEVKFGSYPANVVVDGEERKAGSPIAWKPAHIERGEMEGTGEDGVTVKISWDAVTGDPGWCKLDWVVADPVRGSLANASNMLDVTWEAPDGSIMPLDGYLDPYFQEVYLDAESIPIFTKLARHVSADALDDYVSALEREVKKYIGKQVNYGKAAKRMYNIFRLTGRYAEAAYIRELFDEPASMLYQVWSLIRTIDDCHTPGSTIPLQSLLDQTDQLILAVIDALEGAEETEIVRQLLRLRKLLSRERAGAPLTAEAEGARQRVINIVNNFFHDRLVGMPQIAEYIAGLGEPLQGA